MQTASKFYSLLWQIYEGDDWISEDHLRREIRRWDDDASDYVYEPSSLGDEMNRSDLISPHSPCPSFLIACSFPSCR